MTDLGCGIAAVAEAGEVSERAPDVYADGPDFSAPMETSAPGDGRPCSEQGALADLLPPNGASERRRRYRAVVKRDGETCAKCGTTLNLTLDHIVPKSRGGSNRIANLQILCVGCNQAKGATLDEALVTKQRLRPSVRARGPVKAPKFRSNQHLPECDGVFCMYGCPVFHGQVSA